MHMSPPPPNPITHYGYLAFNLTYTFRKISIKRLKKWLSSKSWNTKEIHIFLTGNKITEKCREATPQKIHNDIPANWWRFTVLNAANSKARFLNAFLSPSLPLQAPDLLLQISWLECRDLVRQCMTLSFWFHSYIFIHEHPGTWSGSLGKLGESYAWQSFEDNVFFSRNIFHYIGFHSIRKPATSCSVSFENLEEDFLLSLLSWEFKGSTGWHDNSNTQFSLLSPSVTEMQLAGLPGKAVAKETAVPPSPIVPLTEGLCCVVLGPLLSKTSLAT